MLSSSCLSLTKQTQVWILFTLALRFYVSCHLNLFITDQELHSRLNLDFGSDVYLIKDGEIPTILKNAKGFNKLIKPLEHNIGEIQFTWLGGIRPSSPSGFSYQIKTWSNNLDLLRKPKVSIAVDGLIPRYKNFFSVSFPCMPGKSGITDIGFSLNFTSGSGYDVLKIVVPKQCGDKEKSNNQNEESQRLVGKDVNVKRKAIIGSCVSLALLIAFSIAVSLYLRRQRKIRRLHTKFDREYELAEKGLHEEKKPDELDLLNHVYDEDEEENAPPKPIFVPKKKHTKVKKWKPSSRYRRSLSLPVKGTSSSSYTPSLPTPSSPGSLARVLENIPEEREEVKEETDDENDEENKPMLKKSKPGHLNITIANMRENPSVYRDKPKKCKNVVNSGNEVTISFSKQEDDESRGHVGDADDFYTVLNDHWKQQFEGYILEREQVVIESRPFAKGSYGYLHRGRARLAQLYDKAVPVCVKVVQESAEVDAVSSFVSEGIIMSKFKHNNILELLGVVIQPSAPPIIITPLMKNCDLNQFLRNGRGTPRKPQLLSTRLLVNFGLQIAKGMEYLAGQRYVHRDLATRNCMVTDDMQIKIADFGLAKEIGSSESYIMDRKIKLPIKWTAIESLNGVFSEKSDVWSFGVLQWEIMTLGKQPYSGLNSSDMEQHLLRGSRLPFPKNCPEEIYTIMRLCWREDPTERPNFSELCSRLIAFDSRYKKYSLESTLPSKHSAT